MSDPSEGYLMRGGDIAKRGWSQCMLEVAALLKRYGYVREGSTAVDTGCPRKRFRCPRTNRWATVGKRTTSLYRRANGGCTDYRNFRTAEVDLIGKELALLSKNLLAQMAAEDRGGA